MQVLIMGTLMLVLATAVVKMLMMHFMVSHQAMGNTRARNVAEASLSAVASSWSLTGKRCSDNPNNDSSNSVVCGNLDDVCDCTCTVRIGGTDFPDVRAQTVGGVCQTSINHSY